MTAILSNFALVGRSYSSDTFQDLYLASITARAARRARIDLRRPAPVWRGSGEPVTEAPRLRLSA